MYILLCLCYIELHCPWSGPDLHFTAGYILYNKILNQFNRCFSPLQVVRWRCVTNSETLTSTKTSREVNIHVLVSCYTLASQRKRVKMGDKETQITDDPVKNFEKWKRKYNKTKKRVKRDEKNKKSEWELERENIQKLVNKYSEVRYHEISYSEHF